MIDIHAHILAGVDDGPQCWEGALRLAKLATQSGINTIIATPHFEYQSGLNSRETIIEKVGAFKCLLEEAEMPLTVLPGTEIIISSYPLSVIKPELITTLSDSGKYVLVEIPSNFIPECFDEAIRDFRDSNLIPIIAHPERNHEVMAEPNVVLRFIELGALIQVNASSLTGNSGYSIMKTAEILLLHNMVHFLASDMHSFETRAPHLAKAVRRAEKLIGSGAAKKLVIENPRKVLKAEEIYIEQPEKYRKYVGPLRYSGKILVQQLRANLSANFKSRNLGFHKIPFI